MDRGMTGIKPLLLLITFFSLTAWGQGQIYKVVDEDGNVTYTDQAPRDGTPPMDLPELSVVSTDYESLQEADTEAADATEEEKELTSRDLRRMYRDLKITQPSPEETFWGTENTVVVAWAVGEPLQEGMKVQVMIDGKAQPASQDNMVALTLDRGEHTASAVLLDARGRQLVTSPSVRFFIHQQSVQGGAP